MLMLINVNVDHSRLTLTRPFYLQSCLKILISATECSVKTDNFKTSFCSGKRISGERANSSYMKIFFILILGSCD